VSLITLLHYITLRNVT